MKKKLFFEVLDKRNEKFIRAVLPRECEAINQSAALFGQINKRTWDKAAMCSMGEAGHNYSLAMSRAQEGRHDDARHWIMEARRIAFEAIHHYKVRNPHSLIVMLSKQYRGDGFYQHYFQIPRLPLLNPLSVWW